MYVKYQLLLSLSSPSLPLPFYPGLPSCFICLSLFLFLCLSLTSPTILCFFSRAVHVTKFLEDQFRIFSGSNDKSVRVWDIPTQKEIHIYNQHQVSLVQIHCVGIIILPITVNIFFRYYLRSAGCLYVSMCKCSYTLRVLDLGFPYNFFQLSVWGFQNTTTMDFDICGFVIN